MTELFYTASRPCQTVLAQHGSATPWQASPWDGSSGPAARSGSAEADEQFVAMLEGYRPSGGLARAEEVLAGFERCSGPDVATLARWIVERSVISFDWQSQTWLPRFQFSPTGPTRLPALVPVLAELTAAYGAWGVAHWFVRPSSCLANCTPVEMLRRDPGAVLDAARLDRFVVNG